jgi:flagellar biosynthesis regulator FlaF
MTANAQALRAYGAASTLRSQKSQDSEIFRRASFKLRAASELPPAENLPRIRAVAHNRNLWQAVVTLVRDPENPLPADLRVQIASVGQSVLNSCNSSDPDFGFMMTVNDAIAAGLASEG